MILMLMSKLCPFTFQSRRGILSHTIRALSATIVLCAVCVCACFAARHIDFGLRRLSECDNGLIELAMQTCHRCRHNLALLFAMLGSP